MSDNPPMSDSDHASATRSPTQRLPIPLDALIISALATATIGLAVALHASGLTVGSAGLGDTVDYHSSSVQHGGILAFLAVVFAGVAYLPKSSPDTDTRSILVSSALGVIAALVIIGVRDGLAGFMDFGEPLLIRPLLTGAAVLFGLGYFAALHTRYDWVAINLAGLIIVPPIIAVKGANTSLTVLGGALVVTAILDYLAVHRSNVMENLATEMMSLRIPFAYFAPPRGSSLGDTIEPTDEDSDASGALNTPLLGMGDVAIPGLFIVGAAATFSSLLPAVLALGGYLAGYAVIRLDPFETTVYAALPFLNTGVLLGFALTLPFL